MELTPEDRLRLNVLLASKPLAIRIDESRMRVHALSDRGEASLDLHPQGSPERYLRLVRELISGQVLGSPGGYPVYIRRWTRMGQMRDQSLQQLLLLGEPEAVVAAVCAPGLDDETARRAWWAMEDPANARHMLANPRVARGTMGPVLARYLLDYLPFEAETEAMMESVRAMLQPGLLSDEEVVALWKKAGRKPAYLVGFLAGRPDAIPAGRAGRPIDLGGRDDPVARAWARTRSAAGQNWLSCLDAILAKPPTQDVVFAALECTRERFSSLRPEGDPDLAYPDLAAEADAWVASLTTDGLGETPEARAELRGLRILSGVGYGILRPLLRDSTAIGSLMRRKLEPAIGPLRGEIARLLGRA